MRGQVAAARGQRRDKHLLVDADDFERAARLKLVLTPPDDPLQAFQRGVGPSPQPPCQQQVILPQQLTPRHHGVGFQVSLHV